MNKLQILLNTKKRYVNQFVDKRQIPLGINRGNIITMPYNKFSGSLGIIGTSGSGKSVLLKRIYSYLAFYFNRAVGYQRPAIIFDSQSEDHWHSAYKNKKSYPLFTKQGEKAFGFKNLVNYAPTYTKEECHNFDKLFGFDLSKIDLRDLRSLGLNANSSNVLFSIMKENEDLLDDPNKFFDFLFSIPTSQKQMKEETSEFAGRVERPINPQIKSSILDKFDPLIQDKVFVGKNDKMLKNDFMKELKKGKIININLHQMEEYAPLYVGIILRDLYFEARRAARNNDLTFKPPIVIIEEADIILNNEDESLNKGSTKWAMEILRRARRYGIFLIFATQEAGNLHRQMKNHCREWLIAPNLSPGDLPFVRLITNTEVYRKLRKMNPKSNGWGAKEWGFVMNKNYVKTFHPFNSPVDINREVTF